jgi:large subunit ribosomal protein L6
MSRIANQPVELPSGVQVTVDGGAVTVKGGKGTLMHRLHPAVAFTQEDGMLKFAPRRGVANADAQAGTARAVVNNMVKGVSEGFERRLTLVGVGYRAQVQGQHLNLVLGYSHPVDFAIPQDITVETPSPTEVVIRGVDKQKVGQVAAIVRGYRPPEPYKGKGIRYSDELVVPKEAKKK